MYIPSSFKEENPEILFELIEKFNFGVLFSHHREEPEATHLPFLADKNRGEHGTLIAHFARANKHWEHIDADKEVLVVFQGPHSYISPSWYKNRETVPTWNYATVHVYGKARIIHEESALREMVTRLTHYHESQVESNWKMAEAREYSEKLLKAITGIEIDITRMEGKFKFNQNKSREDQAGVIEHLDEKTAPGVKEIMQKNLDRKPKS